MMGGVFVTFGMVYEIILMMIFLVGVDSRDWMNLVRYSFGTRYAFCVGKYVFI